MEDQGNATICFQPSSSIIWLRGFGTTVLWTGRRKDKGREGAGGELVGGVDDAMMGVGMGMGMGRDMDIMIWI